LKAGDVMGFPKGIGEEGRIFRGRMMGFGVPFSLARVSLRYTPGDLLIPSNSGKLRSFSRTNTIEKATA
jgi:hypothetical protein